MAEGEHTFHLIIENKKFDRLFFFDFSLHSDICSRQSKSVTSNFSWALTETGMACIGAGHTDMHHEREKPSRLHLTTVQRRN